MKSGESNDKVALITGGARSGKSRHAIKLAQSRYRGGRAFFIATAQPLDEEMAERIRRHRASRPDCFETVEEPLEVSAKLERLGAIADVTVIDCLTLWLSNLLLFAKASDEAVVREATKLAEALRSAPCFTVVVSSEVGSGIVPENPLARRFRDLLGEVNQRIAAASDRVILMVAGYPVQVK